MDDAKVTNGAPRKRKPPWLLGVFVFLLLSLLFVLQSSNLWKNLRVDSASDTLLLYALSSLNFVAFVVFFFILTRSLLKLWRERRALQLGSKIKMKLLIYFFAVSLLPLIAMAVFSYLFMNRALERWFTQMPENVVREARSAQLKAVEERYGRLREEATILASVLPKDGLKRSELLPVFEAGNLTMISVVDEEGGTLVTVQRDLDATQQEELSRIRQLLKDGRFESPQFSDGVGFDVATVPFGEGRRFVMVPQYVSQANVIKIVDNTLSEFDRLKSQQVFVRQIGLTTLGLLTFLLIFASSWTAFYVAKGLTRPIRALAEGAKEIADGNFSHRVDVLAEDELELLVNAFNEMSGKLERSSNELSERRKYTETVLQSLSTGVISFDGDGKVTTINEAARMMLRLEDADFSDFGLETLVSKKNRAIFERLLGRAGRMGRAVEQTVLSREHADGSTATEEDIPVALTATALPNRAGAVLVIEDLSELITAQRAAAWQEVARRMAHEIKNPLTPIQLSAERIAKRLERDLNGRESSGGDPEGENTRRKERRTTPRIVKEGTDTILREVGSLKMMVDEFSRFARLPDVDPKPAAVNGLIRRFAALYEDRQDDLELKLELEDGLPTTLIDEEQLKRAFVNLLDNAIEAFESEQSDKRIVIASRFDSGRELVILEVSDNGKGIPASDIGRLFQPYFSTKGRGTGLGLAIVSRIIREHNGSIKAVSNPRGGARFMIELPIARDHTQQ